MEIDLEFVNGRLVTDRGFDQPDGTLKLDVLRPEVARGNYKVWVRSVPRGLGICEGEEFHRHWICRRSPQKDNRGKTQNHEKYRPFPPWRIPET